MDLLDSEGIDQLRRISASGDKPACLQLLSDIKPYIKHREPKRVLAGLRVLEELTEQAPRQLQQCLNSEEWTRRLGASSRPPLVFLWVLTRYVLSPLITSLRD